VISEDGADDSSSNDVHSAGDYLWAAQSKASAPEALLWEQAFIRAAEKMRRQGGVEEAAAPATERPSAANAAPGLWGADCPEDCRCRPAPVGSVPLYRALVDASANGTLITPQEIQLQPQVVVRVADCAAKDGDIGGLLDQLPADTQVY